MQINMLRPHLLWPLSIYNIPAEEIQRLITNALNNAATHVSCMITILQKENRKILSHKNILCHQALQPKYDPTRVYDKKYKKLQRPTERKSKN